MLIQSVRKAKVALGMHMVKHGSDILGPGTLKFALSPEKKSMNWDDLLHAWSDVIIFG